jgi:hypothetical protein
MDLVQYAARRCPPIAVDNIKNYQPVKADGSSPAGRFFKCIHIERKLYRLLSMSFPQRLLHDCTTLTRTVTSSSWVEHR